MPFSGFLSESATRTVREAWGRHKAFFTGDDVRLPRFDDADFFRAVDNPTVKYPQVYAFPPGGAKGKYLPHLLYGQATHPTEAALKPDVKKLRGIAHSGGTIRMHNIDHVVPAFREIALRASEHFRCSTHMNAYYKGTPGAGAGRHIDKDHTFVLQVWGTKIWRLGRTPAVYMPFTEYYPRMEPDQLKVEEEVVMRAGDVLYMPPGLAHEVETVGASLHVTLGIHTKRVAHLLQEHILEAIRDHPALRQEAPLTPARRLEMQGQIVADAIATLRKGVP